MATKEKAKRPAEKELKSVVRKLRSQLAAAERSTEKWKSRARAHQTDAKGTKAELTAVRRRLDKAVASATKWKGRAKSAARAPSAPSSPVVDPDVGKGRDPGPALAAMPGAGPDDSWTVTRLRAEARARGVTGYSRKTKAQLLADLRE